MRYCKGITLSELLIAMLLGLFLLSMAFTAFGSLSRSVRQTQQLAELQQNAQLLMNLLHNELANTGFWGGRATPAQTAAVASIAAPAADCAKVGIDSGSFPRAGQPFVTLYAEEITSGQTLDCLSQPLVGTELLQLKRLLGQYAMPADMRQNRFYLEADWQQARIVDSSSGGLTPDLDYFPYQHLVFYLQQQRRDEGNVPVLMRKRLARNQAGEAVMSTDSVMDGVERMHFQFGIDTDSDGQLNYLLDTNQMTAAQWQQRIISLRYYVLLRATLPDANYRNEQTYQMGQHEFVAPGDQYRRLLLSNTLFFPNTTLH